MRVDWASLTDGTRGTVVGAVLLFVVVTLAFAPFAYGDRTLASSAVEAPSIYPAGARLHPGLQVMLRGLDPGAAAWQTEPMFLLEHREIAEERVAPLWDPYVAYGQPLAANLLSQPYYPLAWLTVAHPTPRAYNWFVILRFYAAALFAFLYVRYFTGFAASIAAAIAFAFTGYLLLYYNVAHLSVECLIPGLFFAVESVVRRPRAGPTVGLAFMTAVVIFGGMPESAILAFAFAGAYAVVRVACDPDVRRGWLPVSAHLAGAAVLGAAMTAVSLLPAYQFIKLSLNQHEPGMIGGAVPGLSYDQFAFTLLATYLTPLIYGPGWQDIFTNFSGWTGIRGFVGVAPTMFAIVGTIGIFSRDERAGERSWSPGPFFLIVLVLLLLKRFGSPLVNWIGVLPGLSLLNFPKYEEPLIGFCVAVLAAFGVQRLASGNVSAGVAGIAAAVPLSVLTAIAGIEKTPFRQLTQHRGFYTYALVLGLGLTLIVLGIMILPTVVKRSRSLLAAVVLATIVIAGEGLASYILPLWYVVSAQAPDAFDAAAGGPFVTFVRAQTSVDHARFYGEDYLLYPEWSAPLGIADIRDLDALYAARYMRFLKAFLPAAPGGELVDRFTGGAPVAFDSPLERRLLALSSVAYVATTRTLDTSSPTPFHLVYDTDEGRIYHFGGAFPRLALYAGALLAPNDGAALKTLSDPAFDPARRAVITDDSPTSKDAAAALGSQPGAMTAGRIDLYTSQHVLGTIDATAPSLAVLNDTAFPGWRARIDGRTVPILTANYLFRGVVVPPGHHTIEFAYEPRTFRFGLIVTLAAFALALLYLGWGPARGRLRARRDGFA